MSEGFSTNRPGGAVVVLVRWLLPRRLMHTGTRSDRGVRDPLGSRRAGTRFQHRRLAICLCPEVESERAGLWCRVERYRAAGRRCRIHPRVPRLIPGAERGLGRVKAAWVA